MESDLRDAYLDALYCDQDAGWCGAEAEEDSDVLTAGIGVHTVEEILQ